MQPGADTRIFLDQSTRGKVPAFTLARMLLMSLVLLTTIFLRQEVMGPEIILQIYAAVGASFLFSLISVSFWRQTMRSHYYIPAQLLYDLLLTSYLVYLTGVSDSIFLFLYLLNIVFAAVAYGLPAALVVATISGATFAFIYFANAEPERLLNWYNLAWHELLFLLTALLCGQLVEEARRQRRVLERQRGDIARLELLNDHLLNTVPVGILVVDADEYLQKINSTALKLLELEHAPSLRMKYFEFLPTLRGILSAWSSFTETQRLRFLFAARADAPPRFSLQIVEAKTEFGEQQRILVFQDMAKTRELEEKLEFESKLAATGELAAGIAHEIRNPLASIAGSIELLGQHLTLEQEDRRLFDISLRETRRLNTLITDFLEFAKPKDNREEAFSLADLVREVSEAVTTGHPRAVAGFDLGVAPALLARANRERMKQVFFNLFLNSVEAARPAPVRIAVTACAEANGWLTVDVRDDGPGIPAALVDKIFDPFFTTKADGTGLGLPTIAQILKAAHGNVRLVPSPAGAHFQLRLRSSDSLVNEGG